MNRRSVCTCMPRPPLRSARVAFGAFAPDALDKFDAYDAFEAFEAYDDGEPFLRILRVLEHHNRTAPSGHPALTTGGSLRRPDALRQLMNSRAGVFLEGASKATARSWANRMAGTRGGRVVFDAPHGPRSRPHFHLEFPGNQRSGHIFYGHRAPSGDFFARNR